MNSRLNSLVDAWKSEDATELGRAIAVYLSGDPQGAVAEELEADDSQVSIQNTRLRQENKVLHDCIDDMETELAHLRDLNHRQNVLIEGLNKGRDVFKQPPPELLRLIFDFVVPPSFLLDPSISCGPESPWCQSVQAKIALTNVCWTWYRVGVNILYEDIAFRTVGQVSALLRTLNSPTSIDFGRMVRQIGVHCLIPEGFSTIFETDLNSVVARTPMLTSVVLNSPMPSRHLQPIAFDKLSWPITHFDCGPTLSYSDVHETLHHLSSTLVFLSLDITGILAVHPVYTLHRLEILKCISTGNSSALPALALQLALPALKTFIFQYPPENRPQIVGCLAFCKIRGQQLRTLDFRPAEVVNHTKYYQAISVQSILEVCPHLQHLILPGSLASSIELSHPKVKWIDFWTMYGDSGPSFLNSITMANFPAVKGIRQLAVSAPLLIGHIPTAIPPHLNLEDPFQFDYPGLFLYHGNNRVYRNEAVDCLGVEYDEDDTSDEDYAPSSTSSSSTSEDETMEDEYWEEKPWEADQETNLALHHQFVT
ncbi:hypothetical protein C8R43DRAFT_691233 [Mycena crocata]|nr:hypothetical protein C8R43DRAFT_691233 [Mycena crocata]